MIGDDPEFDGPAAKVGMDLFLLQGGRTLADAMQYISAKGEKNTVKFTVLDAIDILIVAL